MKRTSDKKRAEVDKVLEFFGVSTNTWTAYDSAGETYVIPRKGGEHIGIDFSIIKAVVRQIQAEVYMRDLNDGKLSACAQFIVMVFAPHND
jgi:hypothetical protein